MSPDNPFLKALLAEPDDDTLRLAMADWLDENDQPARAEFVRVQIELVRGVEDRERLRYLEVRQRDLLIAHDVEWVKPLADVLKCKPGEWGGWVFRRGFVEYFRLSAGQLLTSGARLAELTPFRDLNLEGSLIDSVAEALIACRYLGKIRLIDADTKPLSPNVRQRFHKRFAAVL
jgi:uncharacterized protein (TIGR02996 family)